MDMLDELRKDVALGVSWFDYTYLSLMGRNHMSTDFPKICSQLRRFPRS